MRKNAQVTVDSHGFSLDTDCAFPGFGIIHACCYSETYLFVELVDEAAAGAACRALNGSLLGGA